MLNGYLSPPLGDKWPPSRGATHCLLRGDQQLSRAFTHMHTCAQSHLSSHWGVPEIWTTPPPTPVDLKVDFLHLVFPTSKKAAAAQKRPWVTCNSISLNSLSERIVWGSFRRRQISTLLMLFGILSFSFFFFFVVWMICWAISSDYERRHRMMLKTCAGKSSSCLPCVASPVLVGSGCICPSSQRTKIAANLTRIWGSSWHQPCNQSSLLLLCLLLQSYKRKTEAAKKEYLKALAAYRASLVSKVTTGVTSLIYMGQRRYKGW